MKKRSYPIIPHKIIRFRGEDWIEVHWPSDGLYDIGYQLAQETERSSKRYMGLFEGARFHLRSRSGDTQNER